MSSSGDIAASLAELFAALRGAVPVRCSALPASGGSRRYYVLTGGDGFSAVGVDGADIRENKAFVCLASRLRAASVNVPEVYAVSPDGRYYLQQYLGDTSLFDILGTAEGDRFMCAAVRQLPQLQCADGLLAETHEGVLQKPFGRRQVVWDLNYFKYCFLKPAGIMFDEELLEDDFLRFADDVLSASAGHEGFMYRDCQSRNIMAHDGKIWWIDFQGGRRGPMLYDIVSLLWQAKAGLSQERRARLLDVYFEALAAMHSYPAGRRDADIRLFALFRTLQVLGAYGFRGLVEHKAHFITSIPAALGNLSDLIDAGACVRYPELARALGSLCSSEIFKPAGIGKCLEVEVISFSYKRGYPTDMSGNGGGFMFDCRALHNPGRYDIYKPLTGMDAAVAEFLESKGETGSFLEAAWQLTDPAVVRYIRRGFTHLQIGFGCTGGRHRSVYCAERTAAHLAARFGRDVRIVLHHREQNVTKIVQRESAERNIESSKT